MLQSLRMRIFQNLNRLRIVRDICPLPGFPSHDSAVWKGRATQSAFPIIEHSHGYTVTDFKNRFITWHRTFTNNHVIPDLPSTSLIHIHEWIPPTHPPKIPGFFQFSMNHFEAVTILTPDFTKHWSTQAKRHLSSAKKNPHLSLRLGTIDEIASILPHSQVPKSLHTTFLDFAKRHIAAHPDDIEVLIAVIDNQPVAGFIAGYCIDARESTYLVGCFTPAGGKAHAMVALIEHWFQRCIDRSLLHANFGDIVGPHPFPFDDMIGYSTFKTHFSVHRVWMPGSRWRVRVNWRKLKK